MVRERSIQRPSDYQPDMLVGDIKRNEVLTFGEKSKYLD